MDETSTARSDLIVTIVTVSIVAVAMIWYGTIHLHLEIRRALEYDRVRLCAATVTEEVAKVTDDCVATVSATVSKRSSTEASDISPASFAITIERAGRTEQLSVNSRMYYGVAVGDTVNIWRFGGKTTAVERGELYSSTEDTPRPPYLAGMVGLLFWAALSGFGMMFAIAGLREDIAVFDIVLVVTGFLASIGILAFGVITDEFIDVWQFDPRWLYLCLALTPLAVVGAVLRALAARLWRIYGRVSAS